MRNEYYSLTKLVNMNLLIFGLLCLSALSAAGEPRPAGCDDGIIRGVNLGGWLLLEPWITPVFFEEMNVGELKDKVVDEWTYAELLDPLVYKARMIGHWSTFVQKSHFAELKMAGISHVR